MQKTVYFNGKFYAAGMNGVHRVADRLIHEIDQLLTPVSGQTAPFRAVLLAPEKHRWLPTLKNIEIQLEPRGHSQFWEQILLPRRSRDGLLVNLCNLAPILHRFKLLMLHDAQFLFPDSSYPWRLRWGYKLLTPLMARTSQHVLTVSDYSLQMLELFGVSKREKTIVVHNGVDHLATIHADSKILESLHIQRVPYVVHIGSTKAYKNTRILFDAFNDPLLNEVNIVLVGPDQQDYERAGLTPPPGAIFAGRVDDAALKALYQHAICLVFPSRTEGFGLPPLEAMTCGCPAVVSPAGAVPEACRDAVLYADVADAKSWIDAINCLRLNQTLRKEKSEMGIKRAAELTWARAGEALLAAITSTLAATR